MSFSCDVKLNKSVYLLPQNNLTYTQSKLLAKKINTTLIQSVQIVPILSLVDCKFQHCLNSIAS